MGLTVKTSGRGEKRLKGDAIQDGHPSRAIMAWLPVQLAPGELDGRVMVGGANSCCSPEKRLLDPTHD